MDTWLDHVDDSDSEPFPLEDPDAAGPTARIMAALTLVSNVLRDSELVKDLQLKERVLHRTLVIWGQFVDLLDADDELRQFWRALAEKFSVWVGMSDTRRERFVDQFCDMASVLVGYGGISATLSSRKLLRCLDACFSDSDFASDTRGSVTGALMGLDIHEPGWTRYFVDVQTKARTSEGGPCRASELRRSCLR